MAFSQNIPTGITLRQRKHWQLTFYVSYICYLYFILKYSDVQWGRRSQNMYLSKWPSKFNKLSFIINAINSIEECVCVFDISLPVLFKHFPAYSAVYYINSRLCSILCMAVHDFGERNVQVQWFCDVWRQLPSTETRFMLGSPI